MVQDDKSLSTAPASSTVSASEEQKILALIDKRYPQRLGHIRRIKPVWNNHFRINYQDTSKANIVSESYFISVKDDSIIEMN